MDALPPFYTKTQIRLVWSRCLDPFGSLNVCPILAIGLKGVGGLVLGSGGMSFMR